MAIKELCNAGLYLVPIPSVDGKPSKGPRTPGWTRPRSAENPNGFSNNPDDFKCCEGFNFGLAHVPSRTCALDIDDLETCLKLFDDLGLPVVAWLNNPDRVEIVSGKPNRGKLLFRVPDNIQSFVTRQLSINKAMLFELRNSAKTGTTVQDVILGVHPETGTKYKIIGDVRNIPVMPDELLNVAAHWDDWKPCFESALGITQPPEITPQRPQGGENVLGWRNPIAEFNQAFCVEEVLLRNGYRQVTSDRFVRPGSTSKVPGAVIMRNCKDGLDRVYSHGGDDLADGYAHDAFDCFRLLECNGAW